MIPVEITGVVESVAVNQFSKDPELLISIICPDPYFTSVDPNVITGQSVRSGGALSSIDYNGSVESGIHVEVTFVSGTPSYSHWNSNRRSNISYFNVDATVSATTIFRDELCSYAEICSEY